MNYDHEMMREIERLGGEKPRLLLHSCCAPCSIPALERLHESFALTLFCYNPNIYPDAERDLRINEQRRLLEKAPFAKDVEIIVPNQEHGEFQDAVRGLEDEPEGGERCRKCFELRFIKCAAFAADNGFGCIGSTITTGPRKDAETVNTLGKLAAEQTGVRWLPSDFKKRGGYLRSVELSKEYGLYRQDFCGCEFSRRDNISNNRKDEML